MATVTVHHRYARIAPRKARLVADMVRRQPLPQAQAQLAVLPKRAARVISRLLRAGEAAAQAKKLAAGQLVVREAIVQEGPRLKRGVPHFRGTVRPINKQMSHITISLSDEPLPVRAKRARRKTAEGVSHGK